MKLLFALLMLGCLIRTAEFWSTEQPLLDEMTEKETSGPYYEPTNGPEEFPTGSNAGCSINQVQCYNSTQCIPLYWVCDNIIDCEDNSDEIDCYRKNITIDQFTTPESQTTEFTGCSINQVQCYNSTQCIPLYWVCDNIIDCEDNSDEIDCYRKNITIDQFTTPESQTTEFNRRDQNMGQFITSEPQITEFTGCNMNQVQCYNSTLCIPAHWVCDNYKDCEDNSDEIDCDRKVTIFDQFTTPESQTTEFTGCNIYQVQCYNSTLCIPAHWVCDNYTDCEDNSDEIDCYRKQTFYDQFTTPESQTTEFRGCNLNQVQCYNSTLCLPAHWVCDDFRDCEDNSDEIDCYRRELLLAQFTTPESQITEFNHESTYENL